MRHIPLPDLLALIFVDDEGERAKSRLDRGYKKLAKKRTRKTRKKYLDKNGTNKWSPIKERFTALLGKKCWYTEVEIIGAPLTIDHYRPVCHYWYLAFDPENFRVACPWANSPEHNAQHGCAGGKGDNFPLLPPALRAARRDELLTERPLILDPCNQADCDLLAFQADGRPILNPAFAGDAIATQRVEESMPLLNLDHAAFNEARERLCNDTADDVRACEALDEGTDARNAILARLRRRLTSNAPFSTAARYYLQLHRHLDWVEALLNGKYHAAPLSP